MSDDHIQLVSSWYQEPTTARAIGDALANIWRTAAQAGVSRRDEAGSDELRQVLIRTSVLNAVVYASSHGVAERADAVMAHLSVTHPARCIVIVAQPDDPSMSLGASLNAQCHTDSDGRPRFCFEQLGLTARGDMVERLPGIVTQLLIHDLPTLLWWPGEPPIGEPFFAAMAGVCDRLIVDSSDFGHPESMLASLADFAAAQSGCASMRDLNWDRLIDWREMVAQFFDAPALRPHLAGIRHVELEYASDPGGGRISAQALLFAGWLASRLGWELDQTARDDAGGCSIRMHGAASVEIKTTAVHQPLALPGALISVRLAAGEGDGSAIVTVEAAEDGEHGTTTVELPGAQPVSRTVRLEPASESVLIGEEMEAFGRERAFDEALHAAGRIARHLAVPAR